MQVIIIIIVFIPNWYEQNDAFPKFMCWSSTRPPPHHAITFGDKAFRTSLRLNEFIRLSYKSDKIRALMKATRPHWERATWGHGKRAAIYRPRKRAFPRNSTGWHPALELRSLQNCKKIIVREGSPTPSMVFCSCGPRRLTCQPIRIFCSYLVYMSISSMRQWNSRDSSQFGHWGFSTVSGVTVGAQ